MENKEFKRIVRKIYINAILVQLIKSISFSLMFEGILLIFLKLLNYEIILWINILVPIFLFIFSFALYLKLYLPSKKDVIKIVDNTFSLKERLITKEEFKDIDNPYVELQKKDAEEEVSKNKASDYQFKISWIIIAILIFSIGIISTGSFIPSHYQKNEGEEVSFVTSSENISSSSENNNSSMVESENNSSLEDKDISDIIDDLKDKIDDSKLDEETKEELKDKLDELEENLKNEDKTNEEKNEQIDQTEQEMNQDVDNSKENQDEQTQANLDKLKEDISDAMEKLKDVLDSNQNNEENQDNQDENNDSSSIGGNGAGNQEGEQIYASDDLIYDYENDRYVSYGELLTFYYNQVLDGINDGSLPSDLEELITLYFASLYNENKGE